MLGILRAGLALGLEGPLTARLKRHRIRLVTVMVNRRMMTWLLWHLTVMVGVTHLSLALDTCALRPEPLTSAWWATRPLWALALLVFTGGIVLVMGSFEDPRPDNRPAPPRWKTIAATVTVIAGLAVMASVGKVGESGVTWWWPLVPVEGMVGFGVVAQRLEPSVENRRTSPGG